MKNKLRCDSHSDLLHKILYLNSTDYDLNKNRPNLKTDIPKLKAGGVNSIFLALFTKEMWGVEGGVARIKLAFGVLFKLLMENKDLELCLNPESIIYAVNRGKIAINLAIENGTPIGNDLGLLKYYYDLGIRYLTLCHNFSNQICDSSTDKPIHGGLSNFGKKIVKKMNDLGMIIDISHASDKTVYDVLELTELPIIASHSNSRAICDNPRNLSDELLEKIAKNGGVVQVSVLPKCVGGGQSLYDFVDHILHIVNQIGINHVGIGTDFDGGGGINKFDNISEAKNVDLELRKSGFSEKNIDKIWGLNFMRVYAANFGLNKFNKEIDDQKESARLELNQIN
jgi:microsomal dipeptidase-like Zn-dependent dipeptidase